MSYKGSNASYLNIQTIMNYCCDLDCPGKTMAGIYQKDVLS